MLRLICICISDVKNQSVCHYVGGCGSCRFSTNWKVGGSIHLTKYQCVHEQASFHTVHFHLLIKHEPHFIPMVQVHKYKYITSQCSKLSASRSSIQNSKLVIMFLIPVVLVDFHRKFEHIFA